MAKDGESESTTAHPDQPADPRPEEQQLGRNVIVLGWVAFFGGLAQDMIQPILPLFYTNVLGLSKETIGLIEGSLTTVVSLMKIGAGYLSDVLGLRKALVFIGYALSALGRFGLGLAGSGASVFGLRITDGVGKGTKDAPRDALVASAAGSRKLGYAFGVQRMLDTLGSVAGPLITYLLLRLWGNHTAHFRPIFLIAGVVAALPLVLIGFLVKERKAAIKKQPISLSAFKGPFALFLVIMLVFTLGNSSDAFVILRAKNLGLPVSLIPIVYALMNLTSALTAVPAGHLADRIGRRRVISYGLAVYAITYLGFALVHTSGPVWVLYAIYGLYYALFEGSSKALVAEFVPEANRAAAYGLFNSSVGIMALPASLIAGALWTAVSPAAPFAFGAVLAALAFVGITTLLHGR